MPRLVTNNYGRVRFFSRTTLNPETGCVEWTGAKNDHGYGQIVINYEKKYVHRLAYELFNGPVSKNSFIMHRCDNPCCLNPRHLLLGDQDANMKDAASKKRMPSGDDHWTRKPDRPCKPGPKKIKNRVDSL